MRRVPERSWAAGRRHPERRRPLRRRLAAPGGGARRGGTAGTARGGRGGGCPGRAVDPLLPLARAGGRRGSPGGGRRDRLADRHARPGRRRRARRGERAARRAVPCARARGAGDRDRTGRRRVGSGDSTGQAGARAAGAAGRGCAAAGGERAPRRCVMRKTVLLVLMVVVLVASGLSLAGPPDSPAANSIASAAPYYHLRVVRVTGAEASLGAAVRCDGFCGRPIVAPTEEAWGTPAAARCVGEGTGGHSGDARDRLHREARPVRHGALRGHHLPGRDRAAVCASPGRRPPTGTRRTT